MAVKIKKVKGVLFDKWLTRLEKRAFGWNYEGTEEEYSFTTEEISVTDSGAYSKKEHHYITNLIFTRETCYKDNIIFKLVELLSNIFSALRRFAVSILGPILIFFLVFFIISLTACQDSSAIDNLKELGTITAAVYGCLFVPSFILLALGFLLDKICK